MRNSAGMISISIFNGVINLRFFLGALYSMQNPMNLMNSVVNACGGLNSVSLGNFANERILFMSFEFCG